MTTETKPAHSQTPWSIAPVGPEFTILAATDDGEGRIVADCDQEANAAFIVRACNSHAALLAALQHIADVADSGTDAETIITEVGRVAEAAIATAEGGDA